MERRSLVFLLLILSSTDGAEFLRERCACLSGDQAAALLGEGLAAAGYPTGYGIGCGAHDRNDMTCLECESSHKDLPDFCFAEWCWVDPNTCTLNHQLSIDLRGRLSKSYAACGHAVPPDKPASATSAFAPATSSSISHLRICPLANTGGYLGTYWQTIDQLLGAVPAFFTEALVAEGDKLHDKHAIIKPDNFLPLCNGQTHQGIPVNGSAFDCCVWLTALGVCDVCLTEASVNKFRLGMFVRFFETSNEARQLISFVEESTSEILFALWGPFTFTAWLITFLVPVPAVVGICATQVRVSSALPAGTETPSGRQLLCFQGTTNAEDADPDWPSCRCCCRRRCYKSSRPARCGWCLRFGLVMYFEVTLVLYTSVNLAHHLSINSFDAAVETLADAHGKGYTVGVQEVDFSAFSRIHNPDIKVKKIKRRVDCLNFMDEEGVVDACITTGQDLEVEHSKGSHCDKTFVGPVLQAVKMGIPISDMVADELLPKLQGRADAGSWWRTLLSRKPKSKCNVGSDEKHTLSWQAVVIVQGAVFVLIIFACVKDLYFWCRRLSGSAREPNPEPLGTSPPPVPELRLRVFARSCPVNGQASGFLSVLPRCKSSPACLSDMKPMKKYKL